VFDDQQAGTQRQQTSHAAVMRVDERGLTLVVVVVGRWSTILPLGGFRCSELPKASERERLADGYRCRFNAASLLGERKEASERANKREGEGEGKCRWQEAEPTAVEG
jgi:hypothetical protein